MPPSRMRSTARRDCRGETPKGRPSRSPWITAARRPASVATPSSSGSQGASPTKVVTAGSSATASETAPPIEKPSSRTGRPGPAGPSASAASAARASSMHSSRRVHDRTR